MLSLRNITLGSLLLAAACGQDSLVQPTYDPSLAAGGIPGRPGSPVGRKAVVYSNFSPDIEFDAAFGHGWTINGYLGPAIGQQAISQQFTPVGTYWFTEAQVALSTHSGPQEVRVFLQADASGLPGEVIEEMPVTWQGTDPAIVTVRSRDFPVLTEGTHYWLSVVAGAPGVLAGWQWNATGDLAQENFAVTQDGSPSGAWALADDDQTRGAFQVNGVYWHRTRP
jgi:hypothetical protein